MSKALSSPSLAPEAARAENARWLKQSWESARAEVLTELEKHQSGKRSMRALTAQMDALLTGLWAAAAKEAERQHQPMPLALMAVGGYGRRELFLHSDIDLLILLPEGWQAPPEGEGIIPWMLYVLWDAGIKVSHQVGSIDEILQLATRDVNWRTSLLDVRRIAGPSGLRDQLLARLHRELLEPNLLDFVEAKLAERDARHRKWGDSRYLLEPNIKDGKGGLRDLHTLYWLAKAAHGTRHIRELVDQGLLTQTDLRAYKRAVEFFSTVRMHLHALAGRAEERVTFEYQRVLAARLGFRGDSPNAMVERFMKRYFLLARSVGRLTRDVCTALEEEKKRKPRGMLAASDARLLPEEPFALEGERLTFADAAQAAGAPAQFVLLFEEARRTGRDIHPRALQIVARHARRVNAAITAEPKVIEAFLRILTAPDAEMHLRRLNDAEILARLIPEFSHVVGQMQFDRYHTYTVDEHILVAVGKLHEIAQGAYNEMLPLASEVVKEFQGNRVLFLAMLCHDIAKGRGGNHPKLGADIARKHALRLGFEAAEQDQVAWLVEHHQLLTDIAFKRDLQDEGVIRALAVQIQSAQRLRLLLLMTVADILAVGPQVWSGWKGTILRELYRKVEGLLLEGRALSASAETIESRLQRRVPGLSPEESVEIIALAEPHYWQGLEDAALPRAVGLMRQPSTEAQLQWYADPVEGWSEVWVHAPDQPGLFAAIAGSFSAGGASILRCQIQTLQDGTALDRFWVQTRQGTPFEDLRAQKRIEKILQDALSRKVDPASLLATARKVYAKPMQLYDAKPSVYLDAHASPAYTVLEISAADRIGLLYDVTHALAAQQANVVRAYISTYGEQAVDVFYLKDAYGLKIEHPLRLQQLQQALLQAVTA